MVKNAIILCSGGLDSVTTANYVKKKLSYKNLIILFFDYKQRTKKQEEYFSKACAKKLGAEFIEIKINELPKWSNSLINNKKEIRSINFKELKNTRKESEKYYVPCRNIIFLTYALALAEAKYVNNKEIFDIFVGFKSEGSENYPDTTAEFVKKINELKEEATAVKGRVIAPLINKDKEEIIVLASKIGVDLQETYSCYAGGRGKIHCGTCLSCRLRQAGFYWANITDPTSYHKKMSNPGR